MVLIGDLKKKGEVGSELLRKNDSDQHLPSEWFFFFFLSEWF